MKIARVRFSDEFLRDIRRQVTWIEADGHGPDWIALLEQGIEEAASMLTEFPNAGVVVPDERGRPGALRKLVLRRLPFVAYYAVRRSNLVFLRLFHARQRRPGVS